MSQHPHCELFCSFRFQLLLSGVGRPLSAGLGFGGSPHGGLLAFTRARVTYDSRSDPLFQPLTRSFWAVAAVR